MGWIRWNDEKQGGGSHRTHEAFFDARLSKCAIRRERRGSLTGTYPTPPRGVLPLTSAALERMSSISVLRLGGRCVPRAWVVVLSSSVDQQEPRAKDADGIGSTPSTHATSIEPITTVIGGRNLRLEIEGVMRERSEMM